VKRCTKCKKPEGAVRFGQNLRNKDGKETQCKGCRNGYFRRHREKNREHRAAWNAKYRAENSLILYLRRVNRRLGASITPEAYKAKLAEQGGACGICRRPETNLFRGKVRRMHFDHCHATGKLRGLLCSSCNLAIGKFGDVPDLLRAAADYLEQYGERNPTDRPAARRDAAAGTLPVVRRTKPVLHGNT